MKNYEEIIFREIGGKWVPVDSGTNPLTLAEYLEDLQIIIDDGTEFARINKDGQKIWYRNYGGKIVLTLWNNDQ